MTTPTLHASQKTKKTHFGEIPVDWGLSKLDQVAVIQTGLAKGKKDIKDPVTLPYLRVANVQDGYFDLREIKTITVERSEIDRYSLRKNDVLLTEGGDLDKLGRGHLWDGQIEPCLHQNHVFVVRTRPDVVLPSFFALQTSGPHGRHYFLSCAKKTTNLASINSTQLKHFPVLVPPLREQQEITAILTTWDRATDRQRQLLTTKQKLKKGLMQQLLNGSRRFPEFRGCQWKQMKIGEFTRPVQRVVKKPDESFRALGIRSHGKGTFLKENFDPAAIEMTELFEVRENDLIVNITFAWEGAIAIAGAEDDGALVSHRFPTYMLNTDRVIPEYFRHVIIQRPFVLKLGVISPGGAGRNRVLSKRDFVKIEVLIPPVAEQRRIAAVLNSCDREIQLLRRELAALKDQKRGLMQKLLTGEVRVRAQL